MKKIKLAVLPGDGIGQEVTQAALPVMDALAIPYEASFGDIGWEFWKNEGNPVPERTWQLIENSDATLLGAITSKPEREAEEELAVPLKNFGLRYVSPVVQLRQRLDLFANVRPCFNIQHDKSFRCSIIRENTEGLYAGFDFYPMPEAIKQLVNKSPWDNYPEKDMSCALRIQSRHGLKRLFHFSFEYARQNHYTKVTFADKPNVLRKSSIFAREIFEEIAACYPEIKAEIHNVDAVALWLVRRPEEFGVIVAENMFGDILSDLAGGVMGGLGFAPSANIGMKNSYFEPVHGSAPRVKLNTANPSAMFLTIGLMLDHLGYSVEAKKIHMALVKTIQQGKYLTYDLDGLASTQDMAQAIIGNL